MYQEKRYIGKANLDWQVDRFNRVKLGGEFTRYNIKAYSHFLDDQIFAEAYKEKPVRWNAFVEDRLDLGDVVLVGGLRYDWFHSKAFRPDGFPGHQQPPGVRGGRAGGVLRQPGPCGSRTRATTTSARTCRCRSR